VARGQSRLRFIMNAHHTSAHIEHVVQTLERLVRQSGTRSRAPSA
jgi:7-keto-8-aminopelargonate synthetase-like enzyme